MTRSAEQRAADVARRWSDEFAELSAAWGTRVRLDGAQLLTERSALTGATSDGPVSAGGACRMLPCADGWIAASLPRPTNLQLVEPLVSGVVTDPWLALGEWAAVRTGLEIVERSRLLGLAVSVVGEGAPPLALPPPHRPSRPEYQPLVVDFSSLWAGPLCARLLRSAGARVVKVESSTRPDGARFGDPRFYELLNAGHESFAVDLSSATDLAVLRQLVDAADIVIEASRPRALAGWGLDAQASADEGTVWLSITAYGREQGDRIGFGDDVAAAAGLVDWADGIPAFVGDAMADPLTGLAAAVAALRAWGHGQVVDLAMVAAASCAHESAT